MVWSPFLALCPDPKDQGQRACPGQRSPEEATGAGITEPSVPDDPSDRSDKPPGCAEREAQASPKRPFEWPPGAPHDSMGQSWPADHEGEAEDHNDDGHHGRKDFQIPTPPCPRALCGARASARQPTGWP